MSLPLDRLSWVLISTRAGPPHRAVWGTADGTVNTVQINHRHRWAKQKISLFNLIFFKLVSEWSGQKSPGWLWCAHCHRDHGDAGLRGAGHLHREAQGPQWSTGTYSPRHRIGLDPPNTSNKVWHATAFVYFELDKKIMTPQTGVPNLLTRSLLALVLHCV